MAIRQRLLKRLAEIERRFAEGFAEEESLYRALADAKALCQHGLSAACFAARYEEIYDGILLALPSARPDTAEGGEVLSLCRELLAGLTRLTKAETAFKKEIVFLPYKASMWDSLESVWRAAADDSAHCVAYVVPIPYCDRKPDGSAGAWHCEKDLFPQDVPVLDWRTVDLDELHPDAIFIHNPYDNQNLVTSVDARYYAAQLKTQTDRLVYIPYFILNDQNITGASIEQFVLTPGVLNADLTIVQSDAMRRAYLDVLESHTNRDRAFWEKRVLGLGSPKLDKALGTKREDLTVPEEWLRVLHKPDGEKKKSILYNTGLIAFLQHNEKMLDKMRAVFRIFKEHRDEIALLWRPHPLLPATIQSMRPHLLAEYEAIVRDYQSEGWGIYDDTPDLNRAIALTDAYYGDASSVVSLYRALGKPIVVQNPDVPAITPVEFPRAWTVQGLLLHRDQIYMTGWNTPCLYKLDCKTHTIEILHVFDYWISCLFLYSDLVLDGSTLYCIPTMGEGISAISLTDGKETLYSFAPDHCPPGRTKFRQALRYGDEVWMIPHQARTLASFHLKTHHMEYYDVFSIVETQWSDAADFWKEAVLAKESIWMVSKRSNQILQFDLQTKKLFLHTVGETGARYESIVYDGRFFWLCNDAGDVFTWEPFHNGLVKRYHNIWQGAGIQRAAMLLHNGRLCIHADQEDTCVLIEVKTGKVTSYKNYLHEKWTLEYIRLQATGDYLYILPSFGENAVRLTLSTGKAQKISTRFSPAVWAGLQKKHIEHIKKRREIDLCGIHLGTKIYRAVLPFLKS